MRDPSRHRPSTRCRRAIRGALAAALASLAGACSSGATIQDLAGRPLGEERWQLVRADTATMMLPDPPFPILQREAISLATRYLERWTIDGGHLFYEALQQAHFGEETASPAFLVTVYGDDRSLAEQSIELDVSEVRQQGPVARILAQGPAHVCYLFAVVSGASPDADSAGNRLVRGGRCLPAGPDAPDRAERELDWLLAHLRVDGEPLVR